MMAVLVVTTRAKCRVNGHTQSHIPITQYTDVDGISWVVKQNTRFIGD